MNADAYFGKGRALNNLGKKKNGEYDLAFQDLQRAQALTDKEIWGKNLSEGNRN